ncbi:MAG: ABC transporter permease [Anaerolineaceae bacterium]|nr:ABC transporter permease [Anaerolineaceae bacterium]
MTRKFWRVVWSEYQRNVFRKSFIMVLLSLPLIITIGVGFGFFIEGSENNNAPVGIVDLAGIFDDGLEMPAENTRREVEFISFADETAAMSALEANQVQGFYVIDENYLINRSIQVFYNRKIGNNASSQFYDLLQINLLSDRPDDVAYRIARGTDVTVQSSDRRRSIPDGGPTFGLMMPLFIMLAFVGMLLISSGYLMGAVADERENRTIEILITSISPTKLIGGKILGIAGIGITLLVVWSLITVLGIFIANRLGVTWFQQLDMDWRVVISGLTVAIPAYVLASALMTMIGAMVSSTQEGQSVSAIVIILHMIPLYISFLMITDPNGTISVILSMLPFTSLMTLAMRSLGASVPVWQVVVSVVIQILCAVGAVFLAGRALKANLLNVGQRLRLPQLFRSGNRIERGS